MLSFGGTDYYFSKDIMKKLLLYLSLCGVISLQSFTKRDLGHAIRSIEVATVEQVLAHDRLTLCEKWAYANLADEVVRDREAW